MRKFPLIDIYYGHQTGDPREAKGALEFFYWPTKLRTHVLFVHRYVNVKNTHCKYVPSEFV